MFVFVFDDSGPQLVQLFMCCAILLFVGLLRRCRVIALDVLWRVDHSDGVVYNKLFIWL